MKKFPRITWVFLAGTIALVAFVFLAPSPSSKIGAASLQRNSGSSSASQTGEVIDPAVSHERNGPSHRALAAYHRLSSRNVFRPLLSRSLSLNPANQPVSGPPRVPGAPLGLLPIGVDVSHLPPGSGRFFGPGSESALPVQQSLGPWTYAGYSSEDGVPSAVLENKAKREGRAVHIGDRVEGARVVGISRESIRFLKEGKAFRLVLMDAMEALKTAKPPTPGAATAPGSPPSPSGTPAPGSPAPGSPAPGTPGLALPRASPVPSGKPALMAAPTVKEVPMNNNNKR